MDKVTHKNDDRHEAAQYEQQQQQDGGPAYFIPSADAEQSSISQASHPKRTQVGDAEDEETAIEPGQLVRKVEGKEGGGGSGAKTQAGGKVGDEVGEREAASELFRQQGSTVASATTVPIPGEEAQYAAIPSVSGTAGCDAQAGAWLAGGAAGAGTESAISAGRQSTSANAHRTASKSCYYPSVYASGVWWHLIVPPGHPPPLAGDDKVYQVVRIPAPWGGRSSFKGNGLTTTFDPPFMQADPTTQPLDIVDDLVRYSFSRPTVPNPLIEQRFKVCVRRTWTEEGRQMLVQEVLQPQSDQPLFAMPPSQQ